MFIIKKKYFLIIENIKDIDLKNIKIRNKFYIIYRNNRVINKLNDLLIFRKICKIKAIKFVGENAIQLHGGMGVVDEYMISHFFKRATMIGILFGNVDFHMKRYTDLTQSNIQSINEDDGINLS